MEVPSICCRQLAWHNRQWLFHNAKWEWLLFDSSRLFAARQTRLFSHLDMAHTQNPPLANKTGRAVCTCRRRGKNQANKCERGVAERSMILTNDRTAHTHTHTVTNVRYEYHVRQPAHSTTMFACYLYISLASETKFCLKIETEVGRKTNEPRTDCEIKTQIPSASATHTIR